MQNIACLRAPASSRSTRVLGDALSLAHPIPVTNMVYKLSHHLASQSIYELSHHLASQSKSSGIAKACNIDKLTKQSTRIFRLLSPVPLDPQSLEFGVQNIARQAPSVSSSIGIRLEMSATSFIKRAADIMTNTDEGGWPPPLSTLWQGIDDLCSPNHPEGGESRRRAFAPLL